MTVERVRIFVGSSTEARDIVGKLTHELQSRKFTVTPWLDGFPLSRSIEASFRAKLKDNDFFVLIFTPDFKVERIGSGDQTLGASFNVVFEAGAAYGCHGLERVILVRDSRVPLLSDLAGIMTIMFQPDSPNLNTEINRVAGMIQDHISRTDSEQQDRTLRLITFIKCRPAAQRRVVESLARFEAEAKAKWRVEFERKGVIWGPSDNFLLFSVPDIETFFLFIAEMRKKLKGLVQQVDTRLIFFKKYWNRKRRSPDALTHHQMVLLSCVPECVELVYDALVGAAQHEAPPLVTGVEIITVGVATGEADVFFITASRSDEEHRIFVEEQLHDKILIGDWLTLNTTSLPISG